MPRPSKSKKILWAVGLIKKKQYANSRRKYDANHFNNQQIKIDFESILVHFGSIPWDVDNTDNADIKNPIEHNRRFWH